MSIKVNILDPMVNCPASSICHHHMVGSYDNSTTVEEFAKRCGILTDEIEHVDADTLEKLEKQGLECVWGYQFLARIDGEIFHHSDPTLGKRRSSIVDNYIWIRLWWWKYCFKDVGLHQHY